jgi:hypothetical protein
MTPMSQLGNAAWVIHRQQSEPRGTSNLPHHAWRAPLGGWTRHRPPTVCCFADPRAAADRSTDAAAR